MKTYISYKVCLWSFLIVSIAISVLDRLLLPLTEGDIVLGRSSKKAFRNDNITILSIELFWMISARLMLVCCSMSFYTMMYAFPNMLTEFAPRWIDMNARVTHTTMHKFIGIWLTGVPAVIHVVILFLPRITSGFVTKLVKDGWNFYDWYDPCNRGFKHYLGTNDVIYYSYDEIYRLLLMIVAFCIAFPISRSDWMLKKSYSWAMFLHMIFGFLYGYDLIRKKSHPLAWYFCIPFVAAYLLDRIISMFWYRTHKFELYSIKLIGENHVAVYGKIPSLGVQNIATADNYFILHDLFNPFSSSKFQRAHPFTAFQNHDPNTCHLWNIGFVMGVFIDGWTMDVALENMEISFKREGEQNKSILTIKGDSTQKAALVNGIEIKPNKYLLPVLRIWGPYRSAFYGLDSIPEKPVVLVAGGAGFAIILSALHILKHRHNDPAEFEELFKYVHIYYTSRDSAMIDFLLEGIDEILGDDPANVNVFNTSKSKKGKSDIKDFPERKGSIQSYVSQRLHTPQSVKSTTSESTKRNQVEPEPLEQCQGIQYKAATLYECRPVFFKLFEQFKGTKGYCFFCGSPKLSAVVEKASKSANLTFKEESI